MDRKRLASAAGVSEKTVRRREAALGLVAVSGKGCSTCYLFDDKLQLDRVTDALASCRRRPSTEIKLPLPDPDRLSTALLRAGFMLSRKDFEKIVVTVAYVFFRMALNPIAQSSGTVEISSDMHERLVGAKHAKRVRRLLEESGIWGRVGRYKAGENSFRYKPAGWCWECLVERVVDFPLLPSASEERTLEDDEEASCYRQDVLGHLRWSLGLFDFPPSFNIDRHVKQSCRSKSPMAQFSRRLMFNHFHSASRWYGVGAKGKRVFHAVSSMPKDLRRQLLVDGERVVEIDIINSQPFFLLTLLDGPVCPLPVAKLELEELGRWVCDGKFYENLAAVSGRDKESRDQFKRRTYRDLMFGDGYREYTSLYRAFRRCLPSAAAAIESIARGCGSLATALQRTEADFIYNHVLPRVIECRPDRPVLTVHDSLLVPAIHADEVRRILQKVASERFSRRPKLKLTRGAKRTEGTSGSEKEKERAQAKKLL
jgi:hypothetical protein